MATKDSSASKSCDKMEDEGFNSPSVNRTDEIFIQKQSSDALEQTAACNPPDPSDVDEGIDQVTSLKTDFGCSQTQPGEGNVATEYEGKYGNLCEMDSVDRKAYLLAKAVVQDCIKRSKQSSNDPVEATLVRCTRSLLLKHEEVFDSMMVGLDLGNSAGYGIFAAVANELFEGERKIVTWQRIVALYSFGGRMASQYQKNGIVDDRGETLINFIARYVRDVVTPFVRKEGGWEALCKTFPTETHSSDGDFGLWSMVKWGALGLGLVTATRLLAN